MQSKKRYTKHYEQNVVVNTSPENVFAFADDHANLSYHMSQSSWMMGGSRMEAKVDEGKGQKIGSHIVMRGIVFGLKLSLDEVIVKHEPPYHKAWETVNDSSLLVIDHYRLGFDIEPDNCNSRFRVYIDYNLSKSARTRILGCLLGGTYAKWCVNQMTRVVKEYFK